MKSTGAQSNQRLDLKKVHQDSSPKYGHQGYIPQQYWMQARFGLYAGSWCRDDTMSAEEIKLETFHFWPRLIWSEWVIKFNSL